MREIDPGHMYELDQLDRPDEDKLAPQFLKFVKRDTPPEKYPGNEGHYPGTTIQECCRVIIARCLYVNGQDYCGATAVVITHQRASILELEVRAALRHGRKLENVRFDIENEPTCMLCGHIQPQTHNHALTPASPPVDLPGPVGVVTGGERRGDTVEVEFTTFRGCLLECKVVQEGAGHFLVHQKGCPNDPDNLSEKHRNISTVQNHDPDNTLGAGPVGGK